MNPKNERWLIALIFLILVGSGIFLFFYGDSILSNSSVKTFLKVTALLVVGLLAFGMAGIAIGYIFSFTKKIQLIRKFRRKANLRTHSIASQSFHNLPKKIIIAFGGLILIVFGLYLLYGSSLKNDFLGAFLSVTGGQIFLWAIGIRLEILANVTSNFDAHAINEEKDTNTSSPNVT